MCETDTQLLNRLENSEILGDLKSQLNLSKNSVLNHYQGSPSIFSMQNNHNLNPQSNLQSNYQNAIASPNYDVNSELNRIKESMNNKLSDMNDGHDSKIQFDLKTDNFNIKQDTLNQVTNSNLYTNHLN